MKGLLTVLLWGIVIYVVYCGVLVAMQRKMMFPRYLLRNVKTAAPPMDSIERLWIETQQGKVEAWLMKPRLHPDTGPHPAVIFAHGNGELIDDWPDEFAGLAQNGFAVLLVEYPGYGRSQGSPSQESITQVFIAAYDRLINRPEIDANAIILVGRSIGGGAICALAKHRPSRAMILMSSFTSARWFASRYLAPGFLIRDPFDNIEVVRNYTPPLLVIHGARDTLIPFHHGRTLSQIAPNGKLISYDSDHNDTPPDWNRFRQDFYEFLNETVGLNPKP
ncbi:MAG: alpha/beta fold hydrolase [Deltaproteobacteria bacterium]|nr:alpha/beta fold hydrolase [Deltaproteobacteria bacterium]